MKRIPPAALLARIVPEECSRPPPPARFTQPSPKGGSGTLHHHSHLYRAAGRTIVSGEFHFSCRNRFPRPSPPKPSNRRPFELPFWRLSHDVLLAPSPPTATSTRGRRRPALDPTMRRGSMYAFSFPGMECAYPFQNVVAKGGREKYARPTRLDERRGQGARRPLSQMRRATQNAASRRGQPPPSPGRRSNLLFCDPKTVAFRVCDETRSVVPASASPSPRGHGLKRPFAASPPRRFNGPSATSAAPSDGSTFLTE